MGGVLKSHNNGTRDQEREEGGGGIYSGGEDEHNENSNESENSPSESIRGRASFGRLISHHMRDLVLHEEIHLV